MVLANTDPLVIFDLKGDQALFHWLMAEAERRARPFKWFTSEYSAPDSAWPKDSMYWPPLRDMGGQFRNSLFLSELLLSGLSLDHGSDYGAGYFRSKTLLEMMRTVEREDTRKRGGGDRSGASMPATWNEFRQVMEQYQGRNKFVSQNLEELEAAVKSLERVPQLGNLEGEPHAEEIRMAEILEEGAVLYFYLPSIGTGSITQPHIAKLAIYALLGAAYDRARMGLPKRQTTIVIDEFQVVASRALAMVMEQSRSFGFSLVLANQDISQLEGTYFDLSKLARLCALKMYFRPTPEMQDEISRNSGEELAVMPGYSQTFEGVDSKVGPVTGRLIPLMIPLIDATQTFSFATTIKPKLTKNEIKRASAAPDQYILEVSTNAGLHDADGVPLALRMGHVMSKDRYEDYQSRGPEQWPTVDLIDPPNPEGANAKNLPTQTETDTQKTATSLPPRAKKAQSQASQSTPSIEQAEPVSEAVKTELNALFTGLSGLRPYQNKGDANAD